MVSYLSLKYKQHGKWNHFSSHVETVSVDEGNESFKSISNDKDNVGEFNISGKVNNNKMTFTKTYINKHKVKYNIDLETKKGKWKISDTNKGDVEECEIH